MSSSRLPIHEPILNPYAKFTARQFDEWTADLTDTIRRALNPRGTKGKERAEDEGPGLAAWRSQSNLSQRQDAQEPPLRHQHVSDPDEQPIYVFDDEEEEGGDGDSEEEEEYDNYQVDQEALQFDELVASSPPPEEEGDQNEIEYLRFISEAGTPEEQVQDDLEEDFDSQADRTIYPEEQYFEQDLSSLRHEPIRPRPKSPDPIDWTYPPAFPVRRNSQSALEVDDFQLAKDEGDSPLAHDTYAYSKSFEHPSGLSDTSLEQLPASMHVQYPDYGGDFPSELSVDESYPDVPRSSNVPTSELYLPTEYLPTELDNSRLYNQVENSLDLQSHDYHPTIDFVPFSAESTEQAQIDPSSFDFATTEVHEYHIEEATSDGRLSPTLSFGVVTVLGDDSFESAVHPGDVEEIIDDDDDDDDDDDAENVTPSAIPDAPKSPSHDPEVSNSHDDPPDNQNIKGVVFEEPPVRSVSPELSTAVFNLSGEDENTGPSVQVKDSNGKHSVLWEGDSSIQDVEGLFQNSKHNQGFNLDEDSQRPTTAPTSPGASTPPLSPSGLTSTAHDPSIATRSDYSSSNQTVRPISIFASSPPLEGALHLRSSPPALDLSLPPGMPAHTFQDVQDLPDPHVPPEPTHLTMPLGIIGSLERKTHGDNETFKDGEDFERESLGVEPPTPHGLSEVGELPHESVDYPQLEGDAASSHVAMEAETRIGEIELESINPHDQDGADELTERSRDSVRLEPSGVTTEPKVPQGSRPLNTLDLEQETLLTSDVIAGDNAITATDLEATEEDIFKFMGNDSEVLPGAVDDEDDRVGEGEEQSTPEPVPDEAMAAGQFLTHDKEAFEEGSNFFGDNLTPLQEIAEGLTQDALDVEVEVIAPSPVGDYDNQSVFDDMATSDSEGVVTIHPESDGHNDANDLQSLPVNERSPKFTSEDHQINEDDIDEKAVVAFVTNGLSDSTSTTPHEESPAEFTFDDQSVASAASVSSVVSDEHKSTALPSPSSESSLSDSSPVKSEIAMNTSHPNKASRYSRAPTPPTTPARVTRSKSSFNKALLDGESNKSSGPSPNNGDMDANSTASTSSSHLRPVAPLPKGRRRTRSRAASPVPSLNRTRSRASSVVSQAPSNDIYSPSIHHHHALSSPPAVRRPSQVKRSGSAAPESPATPASSLIVTRSQCCFFKISIPGISTPSLINFIIPGCAFSDPDLVRDENIVNHGVASKDELRRKTTDFEGYRVDPEAMGVLRKLVGVDLLREQAVAYLPAPGEVPTFRPRRPSERGSSPAPSNSGSIRRSRPSITRPPPSPIISKRKQPPVSFSSQKTEDASGSASEEENESQPRKRKKTQSKFATTPNGKEIDESRMRRVKRKLKIENAAYKPSEHTDGSSSEAAETPTRSKKSTRSNQNTPAKPSKPASQSGKKRRRESDELYRQPQDAVSEEEDLEGRPKNKRRKSSKAKIAVPTTSFRSSSVSPLNDLDDGGPKVTTVGGE